LLISGITGGLHSHGDIGTGVDGHIGNHGHVDAVHVDTDAGHAVHAGHAVQAGYSADGSHVGNVNGQNGHSTGDNSGVSHGVISWFALILNPLVAVSFLTVFGGMGIMGVNFFKWNDIIIFVVALASGVIVSTLLYNFVAKPIYASENTSDVSRENLIGTTAEVTTDIIANGFGTYHVFHMYTPFQVATFVPVSFDAGTYTHGEWSMPRLDAIAARDAEGALWLALTNVDPNQPAQVRLNVQGFEAATAAGRVLTAPAVNAHNTFEAPDLVRPRELAARTEGGALVLDLPPMSVAIVQLQAQ
jgi:membrane protein implicated in regulation of membrane protease activity